MGQHLFTTQTPALTDQNDNTNYTLGTLFTADIDGAVNGIRWYSPLDGQAGRIGLLYRYDTEVSGTELARISFVTTTDGAWNYTPFTNPVPVTAHQRYVAAMYVPTFYTATGGGLNTPISNGDLTAPADDTTTPVRNGRFIDGQGTPTFPTAAFNGGLYFVDVDFTPTATQPGRWGIHI